jgi:hypothetical protein
MAWTKQVVSHFTPEAWDAWHNNSAVVELVQQRSVYYQIEGASSLADVDLDARTYIRQWLDQASVDDWLTFTDNVRQQFTLPAVTYTITDI